MKKIHKKEWQNFGASQNLPSIYQLSFDFVKQLFRIQIQKGGKVLLWNQVKFRMEACYSELILTCKTDTKRSSIILKRRETISFVRHYFHIDWWFWLVTFQSLDFFDIFISSFIIMVLLVVQFSREGYNIRNIFAYRSTYQKEFENFVNCCNIEVSKSAKFFTFKVDFLCK